MSEFFTRFKYWNTSLMWVCTPVILALRRPRGENHHELEARVCHIMRPCYKQNKQGKAKQENSSLASRSPWFPLLEMPVCPSAAHNWTTFWPYTFFLTGEVFSSTLVDFYSQQSLRAAALFKSTSKQLRDLFNLQELHCRAYQIQIAIPPRNKVPQFPVLRFVGRVLKYMCAKYTVRNFYKWRACSKRALVNKCFSFILPDTWAVAYIVSYIKGYGSSPFLTPYMHQVL